MNKEAVKNYFIINGEIISTDDMRVFDTIKISPIYEVIRIMDGIPLFFEEHVKRMRRSAEIVGKTIFRKDQEIIGDIKKLIEANNVKNLNVKLLSAYEEGKKETFLAYFIESYYPDEKVYREGIHTILYHYERKNPNAKVLNVSFKDEVNKKIKEMNAFEALLVNKEGYITEGSRSNMFFVRGEKVFTAPKGEVLLGVTRKHIINVCKELNIDVVEENINIKDLDKIDGGFMSGTSVNVLPISSIDDKKYSSADNNLIKAIQDGYLNLVKNYIEEKKSLCK
ncbi:branched-chain amino acid aminotransferase [Acidilutibacter cellobiosedens]|jgi:branched-chain amino acid aminotransferase|uniref:Branched-chain amino acid aminotransferase n=1 Tax=Acidilutibacter cellobiosedens TaxID=2507161 RepID=A0A410QEZ4_9FIRM|nr:aminotransferase class IV [Acidilutibacter cellobiosedens]MBE6081675.1 branched-chain amino acid aminotransferase [Tissierellaceae bacterium]QAT62476.1 branched-chain amino acid aminotransferase [Acidilutibacter cellobiosedens]